MAPSREILTEMICQLTGELHQHRFRWKPSSLEYMDVGGFKHTDIPLEISLAAREGEFISWQLALQALQAQKCAALGVSKNGTFGWKIEEQGNRMLCWEVDQPTLSFKQVNEMIILGCCINRTCTERFDISHRLNKAKQEFWRERRYYTSPLVTFAMK